MVNYSVLVATGLPCSAIACKHCPDLSVLNQLFWSPRIISGC
ncbi:putative lipoprotein [Lyngbya aestuarii BL J]|uniref:Putative lipoprotein n=1 Tax=Lyngbya aestuarii BL J TaxID=1348334 RepID=U7QG49_9CYAN|nr:putative lipoprotein [Lyngbya aestuarii BL J]